VARGFTCFSIGGFIRGVGGRGVDGFIKGSDARSTEEPDDDGMDDGVSTGGGFNGGGVGNGGGGGSVDVEFALPERP